VLGLWYSYLTMLQRATKPKLPSDDDDEDDDNKFSGGGGGGISDSDSEDGYGEQDNKFDTFLAAFGVTGRVKRSYYKKYVQPCIDIINKPFAKKKNKDTDIEAANRTTSGGDGGGDDDDENSSGGGGGYKQESSLMSKDNKDINMNQKRKEEKKKKKRLSFFSHETLDEKRLRKEMKRAAIEARGNKIRTIGWMCVKFIVILFIGAIVFHSDDGTNFFDKALKNGLQQKYVGRTMIDALYFATVVMMGVG
jgi:hypothetical protein